MCAHLNSIITPPCLHRHVHAQRCEEDEYSRNSTWSCTICVTASHACGHSCRTTALIQATRSQSGKCSHAGRYSTFACEGPGQDRGSLRPWLPSQSLDAFRSARAGQCSLRPWLL